MSYFPFITLSVLNPVPAPALYATYYFLSPQAVISLPAFACGRLFFTPNGFLTCTRLSAFFRISASVICYLPYGISSALRGSNDDGPPDGQIRRAVIYISWCQTALYSHGHPGPALYSPGQPGRAQHILAILPGRKLWMSSLPRSRPSPHGKVQGPMAMFRAPWNRLRPMLWRHGGLATWLLENYLYFGRG